MSGTYLGGGTVFRIFQSERDMKCRKSHWDRKRKRDQDRFDREYEEKLLEREKLAAMNSKKGRNAP